MNEKKSTSYINIVKFIYYEKATKFCEISILLLSYVMPVRSKVEISQNFVAFSEYTNFNKCKKQNIFNQIISNLFRFVDSAGIDSEQKDMSPAVGYARPVGLPMRRTQQISNPWHRKSWQKLSRKNDRKTLPKNSVFPKTEST